MTADFGILKGVKKRRKIIIKKKIFFCRGNIL